MSSQLIMSWGSSLIVWDPLYLYWLEPSKMKVQDVINRAKQSLQDSVFLRAPDHYVTDTLINYLNMTIRRMLMARPDLFTKIAEDGSRFAPLQDSIIQQLPTTGAGIKSYRLVDIFEVYDGSTLSGIIEEVEYEQFGRADKAWAAQTSGVPVKFMRHPRSANMFFLYPRPKTGVTLSLEYVEIQKTYTSLTEDIENLNGNYLPALVDGVVYHVLSIENSESSSEVGISRANMYLKSFLDALGVSLSARAYTDNPDGSVMPREVA
jgi:hypothetical protein